MIKILTERTHSMLPRIINLLPILVIALAFIKYGIIFSILNTNIFYIISLLIAARFIDNKIFELKIISGLLFIFYGILLWRYNVYEQESELSVYYTPLLLIEPTWNPITYGGMPLFFQIATALMKLTGLSEEAVIVYIRFILLVVTTLSMRSFYFSLFRHEIADKKSDLVSPGAHLAGIFLILDFTFSYLTIGDQLKQLLGTPFYIFAVKALIERRRTSFIFLSVLSIACHHLYLPLLVLTFALKAASSWAFFTRNSSLLFIPILVIIAVTIAQLALGGVDYWGDKINHPVDTGLLDGLLLRPGAILATMYYIFFIFLFCKYAEKNPANKDLKFISLVLITLFTISKVNVVGISFVEPARVYSMLAPFFALAVTKVYLKTSGTLNKALVLSIIFIYNILPIQFGAKSNNHLLSTFFSSPIEISKINFNDNNNLISIFIFTIFVYLIFHLCLRIFLCALNVRSNGFIR